MWYAAPYILSSDDYVIWITKRNLTSAYSSGMQKKDNGAGASDRWTRLAVLRSAAAFAAIGLSTTGISTAAMPAAGDLFAFNAPRTDRLVIALVTSAGDNAKPAAHVRLHAGERAWAIDADEFAERFDGHDRFYSGTVMGRTSGKLGRYHAVVLETRLPRDNGNAVVSIWAERTDASGRRRFGNPIVAELLAHDPRLAAVHRTSIPAEDFAQMTAAAVDRLGQIAARAGVLSSRDHAQRVAERFLPDVVSYRPGLPVGFTFAAQNGRHPGDDVSAVTATILTGRPAASRPSVRFRMTDIFPYLPLPAHAG